LAKRVERRHGTFRKWVMDSYEREEWNVHAALPLDV
jgi:hypothetical protein